MKNVSKLEEWVRHEKPTICSKREGERLKPCESPTSTQKQGRTGIIKPQSRNTKSSTLFYYRYSVSY